MCETIPIPPENTPEFETAVSRAVEFLRMNLVIGMPSDTIYGFFARVTAQNAMSLHQLKRRDMSKPFLLVFPLNFPLEEFVDPEMLSEEVLRETRRWPGRTTLVFRKKKGKEYPSGNSVAIRKPAREDNPFFFEVLNRLGEPLLAPSLNLQGEPPLDDPAEILRQFGDSMAALFHAGLKPESGASRILDLTRSPFVWLR